MAKLVAQAGTRALGKVISKFKQYGQDSYDCFKKLFESSVLPVILYSAGVWGFKEFSMLNTVQNRACRFFLGVPAQSPNVGTQGDMGWLSLSVACKVETTRLWSRIMNMNDNRLTKQIFTWSASLAGTRHRNWNHMLGELLQSLDLGHFQRFMGINSRVLTGLVKARLGVIDQTLWTQNLWNDHNSPNGNKLRTYRTYKTEPCVEPYLLLNVPRFQRRTLAKLRIGVLPLEIETGRHSRPSTPLDQRLCKLCNMNEVETELHFLLVCPLYEDQRVTLCDKARDLNVNFNELNHVEQMTYLVKEARLQGCLAKTVDVMFKRRTIDR